MNADTPADAPRRNDLIAAAWGAGHALAAGRHGEDSVGSFFTGEPGNRLMAQLQGAPEGATADDMAAMVDRHVGPAPGKETGGDAHPHAHADAPDAP